MDGALLLKDSVGNFVQIYILLLIVRILLSWFQTADWAMQAMGFLAPVTDPYLNFFRSFIPPLGGIDLSPIVAIFLLQAVGSALGSTLF